MRDQSLGDLKWSAQHLVSGSEQWASSMDSRSIDQSPLRQVPSTLRSPPTPPAAKFPREMSQARIAMLYTIEAHVRPDAAPRWN